MQGHAYNLTKKIVQIMQEHHAIMQHSIICCLPSGIGVYKISTKVLVLAFLLGTTLRASLEGIGSSAATHA